MLHLTDPHLFAGADGELRGTVTAATLQRVLDHYTAGDWHAKRVLVTGDLIQDDSPEAYERFRELMLPLNLRIHCVPGNHDIRDLMRPVCCR
ncbi:MAG: metallophosphoesterase, partial [Gammaproteobacteria bacterium]|nr:metallophosphoesterase [Gammaproteobacteria bacterium]